LRLEFLFGIFEVSFHTDFPCMKAMDKCTYQGGVHFNSDGVRFITQSYASLSDLMEEPELMYSLVLDPSW
jgi:hypothetical protein